MGVKFSELHVLPTKDVSYDDYIAILDVSEGMLKRTHASHAADTDMFGRGTSRYFGHVKLSDTFVTQSGGASEGIAASQKALYDAYNQSLEMCLTAWVGNYDDWIRLPNDEKNKYRIINIIDR